MFVLVSSSSVVYLHVIRFFLVVVYAVRQLIPTLHQEADDPSVTIIQSVSLHRLQGILTPLTYQQYFILL